MEFHPDGGGVKSCDLNGVHALSTRAGLTVHCANGQRAELARDGRLRECTLARPLEANGRRCAAGERIELDEAGRIRTCERR